MSLNEKINIDKIISYALSEDLPFGDITTDNIINIKKNSIALFIAKEDGVIAGQDIAKRVFSFLDENIKYEKKVEDGTIVQKGEIIASVEGNTKVLLSGERIALNFMQRLSGIATKTKQFCEKVEGLKVKITDTRKTIPGLRILDRYAVRVGGGYNHRFCLSDGVLIKDNHIKAAGGIKEAIEMIKEKVPHTLKIEVETENLEQVKEALINNADIIMLDNMSIDKIREAVKIVKGKVLLEVSGNINLEEIYEIASTGINIISIGSLTHSVNALDISMKII